MSDVKTLYKRLRAKPWPILAREVGDFALYESLLAGCADQVMRGGLIDVSKVPTADEETLVRVRALRAKADKSLEETAFLEYFDLLEEIRSSLAGGLNRSA
jgi:hypothetical protein